MSDLIRMTIDRDGTLRLVENGRVVKTVPLGDPDAQRRAARRRALAEVRVYVSLAVLVAALYAPFVLAIVVAVRVMFP